LLRAIECCAVRGSVMALGPIVEGASTTLADFSPGIENIERNLEGRMAPAKLLACSGDLVLAERRAMGRRRALLLWRAVADHRAASDHARLVGLPRRRNGVGNRLRIVAVSLRDVPAGCAETTQL